jgi:hypothetical protein
MLIAQQACSHLQDVAARREASRMTESIRKRATAASLCAEGARWSPFSPGAGVGQAPLLALRTSRKDVTKRLRRMRCAQYDQPNPMGMQELHGHELPWLACCSTDKFAQAVRNPSPTRFCKIKLYEQKSTYQSVNPFLVIQLDH